jgi:hypothetical protein
VQVDLHETRTALSNGVTHSYERPEVAEYFSGYKKDFPQNCIMKHKELNLLVEWGKKIGC